MATVAPTTPIIMTTATLTTTPATTGTPAPRYRAALILPIAHSVTIPTTRRPGRISAMMVCGILVHKSKKKERLKPLFFYARHFLDDRPEAQLIGIRSWPVSLGGCGFDITCGARCHRASLAFSAKLF